VVRIKKAARREADTLEGVVLRFWCKKHQLPPAHPMWVGQPFANHLKEFFQDRMLDREDILEKLKNIDVDPYARMQLGKQLDAIDSVLSAGDGTVSEAPTEDLLAAYWEWQDDNDEDVDLDMTVQELQKIGWKPEK